MSEPLEKLEQWHTASLKLRVGYGDDEAQETIKGLLGTKFAQELLPILNAAIDRINELEAKYENHYHEYESYAELAATSEPMQFAPESVEGKQV